MNALKLLMPLTSRTPLRSSAPFKVKASRRASRPLLLAAAVAAAFAAQACGAPKPEPEIASSANQAGYAETYPDTLQSIMKDFGAGDDEAKTIDAELPSYPDDLKNPNFSVVLSIATAADDAGRSRAYVERTRETEGAEAFFAAKKDEIGKKVAGAAQYVAKQKGCEVDVQGAVLHSLEESVEKQLEERMRERNEAHRIIERNRVMLGKETAEKLEKQADKISRASYLVHIVLVESKVRLNALLLEAEQIKKTLDEAVATEQKFQGEAGRTDAEKKASQERVTSMEKSRGLLDSSITSGNELAPQMDERIQAAQKRHAEAMTALRSAIEKRGKSNATLGM